MIAYLTAAYVLGPMLAPPIGGHLTVLFGWRALFVFASAVGLVVILAVAFAVPETRARNAPCRVAYSPATSRCCGARASLALCSSPD